MRIKKVFLLFEPVFLYFLFFAPSLSMDTGSGGSGFFLSPARILFYIALSAAQVFFILYLIHSKKMTGESGICHKDSSSGVSSDISPEMAFGSPPGSSSGKPCSAAVSEPGQGTRLSLPLIPAAGYSLAYSMLLLVFSNVLLYLLTNAFSGPAPFFSAAPLPADKKLIPLYFFASLATGYREELFFRSYLLPLLSKTIPPFFAVAFSSALFAACHIQQGGSGIILSFANSLLLSAIFLRHKNFHINSLTHAFFNFFILVSASIF